MPVGDINSKARGSGARFNDDKPPMEFVPLRAVAAASAAPAVTGTDLSVLLDRLDRFERGDNAALDAAMRVARGHLFDAARVFEFGAAKYAAWNWAKGMKWSVPLACIKRHARAIARGETDDPESKLPHMGHIVCNVIMLHHFAEFYPELDDRPPAELFTAA